MDTNSKNKDVLTNLNEVICAFSGKSDFSEIEHEFYSSISSIIPAHATAIYLFNSYRENPNYISGKGVDNDFLTFYEKKGRNIDPLKNWILTKRSPNQSQLLLGLKGWQHHPVYEIVKTASIDFAMQAPIIHGNEIIGSLNFGRSFSEGAFSEHDLHSLSILSRFMGFAISGSLGKKCVAAYTHKFCNTIEKLQQNILITDSDFNVSYANNAARETIIRHFGDHEPEIKFANGFKKVSEENENKNSGVINKLKYNSCSLPGAKKKQTIVFLNETPSPSVCESIRNVLTSREIDVLLLVERGLKNKEIAAKLFISVNTVKRHLDNIFCKLDVSSRTKLISKFYHINNSLC